MVEELAMSPERTIDINNSNLKEQVKELNNIILSFAQLDFTKRANIKGGDDVMNSLAAGINMLGEELQHSVISLQEKETLLKEIHHRVKNNLQIISSILHLQAEFSKNVKVKKPLEECQNRIKSMALLHEKLYESKDLRRIEVNDYLADLINSIKQSISNSKIKIDFSSTAADLYVNIDKLLPIGLIINELVSNSLEHAFINTLDGQILINFSHLDDQLKLVISDNGIGYSADSMSQDSLGLQLVEALVEQIEGSWSVSNKEGTSSSILFQLAQ